ncbi:MAG TPA: hypothetical protein VGJ20_14945 [Xanthobacteraceae bacterium]|jgi:hypothetical protein
MRIRVEHAVDHLGAAKPRSFHCGERQVGVLETLDQWFGPDYRYLKVKGDDDALYMLRFDEGRDQWTLVMFVSARGLALAAT